MFRGVGQPSLTNPGARGRAGEQRKRFSTVEIIFCLQNLGTLAEFIQDSYLSAWFALKISNLSFPN